MCMLNYQLFAFCIQPFFSAERLPICRFLQRSIILLFNVWRCFLLLIWLGNELFTLQYKINDEQNMKNFNLIWITSRKKQYVIDSTIASYLFLICESVSRDIGSNIPNSYIYFWQLQDSCGFGLLGRKSCLKSSYPLFSRVEVHKQVSVRIMMEA